MNNYYLARVSKLLWLSVFASVLAGLFCLSPVAAQANTTASGITVTPYIEQLTLQSSQNTTGYAITLTNHNSVPVEIHISATDFTNLNENGEIGFYAPGADKHNPYSLRQNLSFPYSEIILGPKSSQTVPITINNAKSLASGGHFGAILFSTENTNTNMGNTVILNQSSASLLFLSTSGQGTQSLSLTTPVLNSFYATLPTTVNIVFSNTGNTQTTPLGLAQILNSHDQVVAQGQININSGLVLPDSKRLFAVNLNQFDSNLWPGTYHLKLTYQYRGASSYQVYEQSFVYVSTSFILSSTTIILLMGLLIKFHARILPKRKQISRSAPLVDDVPPDMPKIRRILVTFDDDTTYKIL